MNEDRLPQVINDGPQSSAPPVRPVMRPRLVVIEQIVQLFGVHCQLAFFKVLNRLIVVVAGVELTAAFLKPAEKLRCDQARSHHRSRQQDWNHQDQS